MGVRIHGSMLHSLAEIAVPTSIGSMTYDTLPIVVTE